MKLSRRRGELLWKGLEPWGVEVQKRCLPCHACVCVKPFGPLRHLKWPQDVNEKVDGKHVIFIEDIVDTGNTIKAVCEHFHARGASSLAICTLLDKKARREVDGLQLRYIGFDCALASMRAVRKEDHGL